MKQKWFNTSSAGTFGTNPRKSQFEKKTIDTPGPGRYKDESFKNLAVKNASFSFGKDLKSKNVKSITPGPGYYLTSQENTFGKTTPKFSMAKSKRPDDNNLNASSSNFKTNGIGPKGLSTPGPGQYKINSKIGEGPKVKKKKI